MAQLPVGAKAPQQGHSISRASDATISVPAILPPAGPVSSDDAYTTAFSQLAIGASSIPGGQSYIQPLSTERNSRQPGLWPSPDNAGFTFRCFHNTSPRPSQVFPAPSNQAVKPSIFNVASRSTTDTTYLDLQQSHRPVASPSDKFLALRDEDAVYPTPVSAISTSLQPPTPHHAYPRNSLTSVGSGPTNLVPASARFNRSRAVSDSALIPVDKASYDPVNERKPDQPFYANKFQTALTNSISLSREMASMLSRTQASTKDAQLLLLKGQADAIASFEKMDTRTIAVLGVSGEGKSSVINSLLHYPEIARTGDLGSACTAVVTEYRQKTNSHTAEITIEVEHLSGPEIDDLITELVWNYSKLSFPSVQTESVSAEEFQRHERESEVAWSSLEAAFKHRREFNRDLLKYTSEEGIKSTTKKLIDWTKDLQWPTGGGDDRGVWRSTASTADECCAKTDSFMQDKFWPFTKIIRVFLSAQILKAGIVLADLPGLQDTNAARVRATQDYLSRSDHILLVARISRAITDASLKSSLYTVLKRHVPEEWEKSGGQFLNVAVVCTMSEEINEKNARKLFCGPGKQIKDSVITGMDEQIDRASALGDGKLKKDFNESECLAAHQEIRSNFARRKFLLVAARNAHVQEGLCKSYAEKVPGRELRVFCVSNTTYQDHTRKGNLDLVISSGIPSLRQFCYLVTADAQYAEAKHFIQAKVGSLLNSIQIWATSGQRSDNSRKREGRDALIQSLEQIESKISTGFKKAGNEFTNTFNENILQLTSKPSIAEMGHESVVDYVARTDKWQDFAEGKGKEWSRWHNSQYNAWCRNHGDHQTPGRGYVNWNHEMIWKMRSELDYQWDILEDEISVLFDDMRTSADTEFEAIKIALQGSGLPPEMSAGVDRRMQTIAYELSLAQQSFACEIRRYRRNTCDGNATSYIVREMDPAYRHAAQQYGTGRTSRQISAIQGCIGSDILFANIFIRLEDDISRLVRDTRRRLRDKVLAIVALVRYDLQLAVADRKDDRRLDEAKAGMEDALRGLRERYDRILADISGE